MMGLPFLIQTLLVLFAACLLSSDVSGAVVNRYPCKKGALRPPAPISRPCLWNASYHVLDCSYRGLRTPPPPQHYPLEQMRTLLLAGNRIQALPCDGFSSWPRLIQIDLSNNGLRDVDPNAFYGLFGLRSLNLSSNRLNESALITVVNSVGRRSSPLIDLRRNSVRQFTKRQYKRLKPHLLSLYLWPNPLVCSCPNQPLLIWLDRFHRLRDKRGLNRRCPPKSKRKQNYVEFINDRRCLNVTKFRLFITTTVVAITVLFIVVITYVWKKRRYEHEMRRPSTILFKREQRRYAARASTARNSIASRCFVLYEQMYGREKRGSKSPRLSVRSASPARTQTDE